MDEEAFYSTVQERATLESTEDAEAVAAATLGALSRVVTYGAAEEIAEELPDDLAAAMTDDSSEEAEQIGTSEFLSRVRNRVEGRPALDSETTEKSVQAVFTALQDEMSADSWDSLASQLPADYARLYETE